MVIWLKKRWRIVASVIIILLWVVAYCHVFGDRYVPPTKEHVPRLIKRLTNNVDNERELAAINLGEVGPDAKEAVPALIKALNDTNEGVRGSAAFALGKIGPDAKGAVPALLQKLDDNSDRVRASTALSLGQIGPEPGVLKALIKALDDEYWVVRSDAALGLCYLGADAAQALSKLREMASNLKEHTNVRYKASEAVKEIETELNAIEEEVGGGG